MSTLFLKSPYIRAHTMPKDKKGQKKVQMLKKTTVRCHSMSYITVHTVPMLQVLAECFAPL